MGPIEQARALINSWLGRGNTDQPLTQPTGNAVNTKWGQIPFKGPTGLGPKTVTAAQPSATPFPSATPMPIQKPQGDDGFVFDYNSLPRDQEYATTGPRPNFNPQQPPSDIGQLIRDMFPNEATAAALVAASENATFDSSREDNVNKKDGSRDRGIFQINSDTFNGLMERQGDKLRKVGITSFEDMRDPKKNTIVAKMIKQGAQAYRPDTNPKGWSGWYGWQDTGYNINDGWFAPGRRADYEEKKKGKK